MGPWPKGLPRDPAERGVGRAMRPDRPRLSLCRLQPTIDAALEFAIERDGFVVGKGQDLGHEHAGNALLRIEPIIGVVNPGPGAAAGAAAVGTWLRGYHVAKSPFGNHAG